MRMLRLVIVAMILAGCSKTAPPLEAPQAVATAQQASLYDQLHSGLFQADAAVKKLGDAVDLAGEIQAKSKGDRAQQLKGDMIPTLDDAGSELADLTGQDLPDASVVEKDPSLYGAKRKDLIDKVSDILKDIKEQEQVAGDMAANDPDAVKPSAKKLDELLDQVIDDLNGALEGLGAGQR